MGKVLVGFFLLLLSVANTLAQQVADTGFEAKVGKPAYEKKKGPVVLIDEAHYNFHTSDGRFAPFAGALEDDGYVVRGLKKKFDAKTLSGAKILVIANALNEENDENWKLPTPSAFTDEEIAAVKDFVKNGGSLFLIVDHMPFPGAAEKLGATFGIRFVNGFAMNQTAINTRDIFKLEEKTLVEHTILKGRGPVESVTSVMTFTGCAFQADKEAKPLLRFKDGYIALKPEEAWKFNDKTPRVSIKDYLQGATLQYGKGRVAVFGEAAMFTAQLSGQRQVPVGLNAPGAEQNTQFLLNVMHWLSGLLNEETKPAKGVVKSGNRN
jgi:hypothetical protein